MTKNYKQMKKIAIFTFLMVIGLSALKAQQLQFSQEKLGTCDSSKLVEITARFFPDTIKWDSLQWQVNGIISSEKEQIIKSNLGDSLIIAVFYGSPVNTIIDTFVVYATESILFETHLMASDRYALDTSAIYLADSSLFSVSNWTVNSGSIIAANSGSLVITAEGSINISATYNSGCIINKNIYIPMEEKPDLKIAQTRLADPLGQNGIIAGSLSDGSMIDSVNRITFNATDFTLQLRAGLRTVSVYSGRFSWVEQIVIESLALPNYKVIQTRFARWCDFADAEIQISSDRGIIDSIANASMFIINNDTAIITASVANQVFTIYNGNLTTEITYVIEKEDDWSNEVYISEIKPTTCSESSDAWAIISYPTNIISISVDNLSVILQDSLKSLSSGNHQITLTDDRACVLNKTITIPRTTTTCIGFNDAFSPNGDGINDIWTPFVPEGTNISIQVYTYRDLNMNTVGGKIIFEGTNTWDGLDQATGTIADAGFYLIVGTIVYPAYMNIETSQIKEIIKLVK